MVNRTRSKRGIVICPVRQGLSPGADETDKEEKGMPTATRKKKSSVTPTMPTFYRGHTLGQLADVLGEAKAAVAAATEVEAAIKSEIKRRAPKKQAVGKAYQFKYFLTERSYLDVEYMRSQYGEGWVKDHQFTQSIETIKCTALQRKD